MERSQSIGMINQGEIIMTDYGIQRDSSSWVMFVKMSFGASIVAMVTGIFFLPSDYWVKGYMAMGLLFVIGSTFTLAKTTRDQHEAQKLINQIQGVKTEKILKEYDTLKST